jgi:cytochrome P450 family 135
VSAVDDTRRLPGSRLPTVLQTALFGLRPVRLVRRWQRRYGDVFTVKLVPTGPFAYVADLAAARSVFAGEPATFHAGESNRMLEPVNGARSVVVLDEERHARARRILLPLFRPARLAAHRPLIRDVVERELAGWPVGRPFRLRPRMQAISLEVIVRTTLGDDPESLSRLGRLLPELLRVNTLTWIPGLGGDLGPLSPGGRLRRVRAEVDAILYDAIARARGRGDTDGSTALGYLLGVRDGDRPLPDEELRDHLATLLLAGHETTSTSLSWAFERLLRHPAAISRLRAELERGDETYLDAVVKETLRSRAVVMDVGRTLRDDQVVAGRALPAGSQLRVAITLIHHRPDLFPSPHEFRPERFLDGEVDPAAWMPFGGGIRRCLGASLALLEMKVVVATVIAQADLRPAASGAEAEAFKPPRLTLGPARGTRVVLERRRPAAGG